MGRLVFFFREFRHSSPWADMELVGKGEVLWTETRTVNSQTLTDHFTSSREYVEHKVGVHQGPHLPPGDHIVPFTLVLPPIILSLSEYLHSKSLLKY